MSNQKRRKQHVRNHAPRQLTEAEVGTLADELHGTRMNVHRRVDALFGCTTFDSVFDQLHAAGVFKCEQCNVWHDMNARDPDHVGYVCTACTAEHAEEV